MRKIVCDGSGKHSTVEQVDSMRVHGARGTASDGGQDGAMEQGVTRSNTMSGNFGVVCPASVIDWSGE